MYFLLTCPPLMGTNGGQSWSWTPPTSALVPGQLQGIAAGRGSLGTGSPEQQPCLPERKLLCPGLKGRRITPAGPG